MKRIRGIQCVIFVVGLTIGLWKVTDHVDIPSDDAQALEHIGDFRYGNTRKLLQLPNCTPRAIEQFPKDAFTDEQRKHGAVVIHVLATLYMFLGFALLCDAYFVPSLEVICDVLHIQSDVAGATFMAAGSSAPELATAVIAVFVAKDDIGLGTVVGSAVYNVLFVISICALFAGMVVHLRWWPLFRDCLFYTISVAALTYVILDEKIYWYEALGFVVLYLIYVVLMYFNASLEAWIVPKFSCCGRQGRRLAEEESVLYDRIDGSITTSMDSPHTRLRGGSDNESDNADEEVNDSSRLLIKSETSQLVQSVQSNGVAPPGDLSEEPTSVFAFPDVFWKQCIWVASLPLKSVFYVSIPDCRYPRWRRWYGVAFLMSLVWLSALSYLMVWMITIIGYTAGLSDSIMGLTFVAFGVSLPDVISSLIVVKEGLGDMAVSNAVGSNVFDILICLGVPWLIKSAQKSGEPVEVYSKGLTYASLTLLGTVLFLLVATHVNGWRLTRKYGIVLMGVYLFFTVMTSLYELNVFGYFHPDECPSNY